ncbi:MAG: hypothetical protein PHY48_02030 [Candidatus Cloacimonetes bacterium]|nr:hypothetical protein [Candidatus Cloacimonadota bacterium]
MKLSSMFTILLVVVIPVLGWGFEADATNRFTLSDVSVLDKPYRSDRLAANWMLTLHMDLIRNNWLSIDAEAVNNFQYSATMQDKPEEHSMDDKLYRAWIRLSAKQTDLRIGLQRLNLGSASIIRPLKWFDKLNPIDVLQNTDGVQAALIKSYFSNNSTLWAWAILADGKLKGYETVPTKDDDIELGGRYQLPFLSGEAAISANHRRLTGKIDNNDIYENRVGFDMRVDSFAGLWVENSLSNKNDMSPEWALQSMLGTDYTFDIGSGLYAVLETGINHSSNSLNKLQIEDTQSALMLNYPLGLLDTVIYLSSVEWEAENYTQSCVFRRSYDSLVLELSASYAIDNKDSFKDTTAIQFLISYTK